MKEETAIERLGALAQQARLRVFRALVGMAREGLTPGELSVALDIPASTLSFHLKELVRVGLVEVDRQGRNMHYRPRISAMTDLVAYLTDHCCGGLVCDDSSPLASSRC